MKKILFTGFEPFGGEKTNPSWDAVSLLPERIGETAIVKVCLPVEYDSVRDLLKEVILREKADAVICTGQAGGRMALTPELIAINYAHSAMPDNAGIIKTEARILPDGPAACFSTLPVRRIAEAMRQAGVPAEVSYSAGAYVCNSTMYHLLNLLADFGREIPAGFIHLPFSSAQAACRAAAVPSLPTELMAKGLEAAAAVVSERISVKQT